MKHALPDRNHRPSARQSRFARDLRAWNPATVRCEAKPETAQMMIFGPIGTPDEYWMPEAIDDNMVAMALGAMRGVSEFDLLINSPGGDAWIGVSIYNLLKNAPQKINVRVTGAAMSAASVIAMAGDTVKMETGSTLMIHRAWTCQCGDAIDMRELADFLDVVDQGLASIYAERTGRPAADILATMHPDRYMTAEQAIADGFADDLSARRGDDDDDEEDDGWPDDAARSKARASAEQRAQFFGAKPASLTRAFFRPMF